MPALALAASLAASLAGFAAAGGLLAACGGPSELPAERPNILLVLADDLGMNDLAAFGQGMNALRLKNQMRISLDDDYPNDVDIPVTVMAWLAFGIAGLGLALNLLGLGLRLAGI